jgi:alkyldihydroxyacetonephosphate synthase
MASNVDTTSNRARECCADHGGTPKASGGQAHREGAAGVWRNAFIRMPYAMERLILRGVINDTFETAISWERFEAFLDAIKRATATAIRAATGRAGEVTCRFTHVYPDGPAPYFTFPALGETGRLGAQWLEIKSAALDAVIENGGTVTHHHAVGRDHRPWYDRQRPPLFAAALRAAKKALDPQGLLNPGVLIDP